MRSNHIHWLPPLVSLSSLVMSGAAHATVVWPSTFEKGDLSEWGTPHNRTTTLGFGVDLLGITKVWTGDFAVGKWHQVAMHVHWSVSPQPVLGTIDVWFDGQQVVTAYKYKTKPDMNTLFFQTGLHRRLRPPGNIVDTIYFDDFVEADSFADAAVAAPIQPGGDGGATSGAAADGSADGGGAGSGRKH